MEFRLPRQKIEPHLLSFYIEKIKELKLCFPKPTKKQSQQIAAVSQIIIEKGLPDSFVIKKLKAKLGFGVFLHPKAKPIQRGDVIAPYAGEVLLAPQNEESDSDYIFALITGICLTKEEHRRFHFQHRYHPRRIYSFDLDAQKQGNFTRFINHSEFPNIEARMLNLNGCFEIVYIAKKKIQPGEQLLVCYEGDDKSYWNALGIKPFPMNPKTFYLDSRLKIISKLDT